ncbi:MAG: L,D-transpeptidase family protein [Bacteroidota bacterium]
MHWIRVTGLAAILSLALPACGSSAPAPLDVAQQVGTHLASLERGNATIRGERLWEPKTLARFYRARQSRAAWSGREAEDIVQAIRGITRDGLNPSDYHLNAIERLMAARNEGSSPGLEGDLDILLSDAVAAMIDHVRYGRVQPVSLNPTWNVDPRDGAPPLERKLEEVRSAPDLSAAIEAQRPDHFIYKGLVHELARLRDIDDQGGWPTVSAGRALAPGMHSDRIPDVRRRLEASGDFHGSPGSDATYYSPSLADAVRRFQAAHRLNPDGIIGPTTVEAMNGSVKDREDQVRANLERTRWILSGLGDEFLLVNIPAYKAYLIRGRRPIWEARTQVGDEYMKTPSFRSTMRTIVFNPDWVVPTSIARYEVLDAMRNGDNKLMEWGLRVYDKRGHEVNPASVNWDAPPERFPYTLRQLPGSRNPLGRVKFLFPNKYSIYLHDTPSKSLFAAQDRSFSHGCIRVENALQLADLLLQDQRGFGGIQNALASGRTQSVQLQHPIPVVIVYWTVSVGAAGNVSYSDDVYHLDRPLSDALGRRR